MGCKEDLLLLDNCRKPSKAVCPAAAPVKSICRDRTSRSTLLTRTGSHIEARCRMCARFGEASWTAFVKYVEVE